jgi:hypothetical protein
LLPLRKTIETTASKEEVTNPRKLALPHVWWWWVNLEFDIFESWDHCNLTHSHYCFLSKSIGTMQIKYQHGPKLRLFLVFKGIATKSSFATNLVTSLYLLSAMEESFDQTSEGGVKRIIPSYARRPLK